MRKILIILAGTLLIGILPENTIAQIVKKQSVYLKNKSVIKGEIIENRPGEFVNIQIDDTLSLKIPYEQIKRVSFSEGRFKLQDRRGLISVFETGAIFGRMAELEPIMSTYSVHIINGYQFSNHFQGSIGLGYDDLLTIVSLPLYISLRGDFLKSKFTPIYQFDIGHSFVKEKQDIIISKGGVYLNPGLGFKNYFGDIAWAVSFGYRYQKSTSEYDFWGMRYNETRIFNRMTFKTSIYF